MTKTLFEKIGGDSAVRASVMKMYDKILDDEVLAPFFEDVSVDALRRSQTEFVKMAFGGPSKYQGQTMRAAHKNAVEQGLTDLHFDKVKQCLADSMKELGVDSILIEEALGIVESTRADVLNR